METLATPTPGADRGAINEASVELLDAGDALTEAIGRLLDCDDRQYADAYARACGTVNRWTAASNRFLSLADHELEG